MQRIPLPLRIDQAATGRPPLCPSAEATTAGSVVFGVIGGTPSHPHVQYLQEALPVTDEVLALSGPVAPEEVFRFAAPCAEGGCKHFHGSDCRLATRIVESLPSIDEKGLPPCIIRPSCRWWLQEGKAACRRCTQLVREVWSPSQQLVDAADPNVYDRELHEAE